MQNKHEPFLTSVFHSLSAFHANSIVPRHTDDLMGAEKWIINKEEDKAIELILATLADCGAETDIMKHATNMKTPKKTTQKSK